MTPIFDYEFTDFRCIQDIIILVIITYCIHKYTGTGMKMNITDQGNLCFILTLSFASFFAGLLHASN